jgi:hypothetical protein
MGRQNVWIALRATLLHLGAKCAARCGVGLSGGLH